MTPSGSPRHWRRYTVPLLLVVTGLLGAFAVWVAFGLATEYADTTESRFQVAVSGVQDWWIAFAVVAAPASMALLGGVRSRQLAVGGAALLGLTVLGVAVGSVAGAAVKHDRFPTAPSCGMERSVRPTEPAAAAAEDALGALAHPAPFSGGMDAGSHGCANELMVREATDPVASYRRP